MAARWSSENVVVEFRDSQVQREEGNLVQGGFSHFPERCLLSEVEEKEIVTQGELDEERSKIRLRDPNTGVPNPRAPRGPYEKLLLQDTMVIPSCLCGPFSRRRFLYIVNLDAPADGHRKISRQSKWDIGAVQWNPHESHAYYFAASSNQRVDLYKWKDGNGEIGTSLQGHTRVIRDTRKPTVSLSAVAGASQVKWNKKNANCLATSHDGNVRIWDKRKPSTAVEYLAAHLSKIHGLDWHPDNENILATSSQDNSVRFWDYRQPRKYLNILACQVPVWKARYTPFSNGLVTVMVPQLRRENSLLLWDVCDLNTPVHTFVGHDDVLCSSELLEGVEELMDGISLLPEADKALPVQDTEPQQNFTHGQEENQLGLPQTLQQEFSLINVQIRNVNMEMDAVNRSCTVSVHCSNHRVKMLVMFPAQYPNNAAPSFQFVNQTTIPSTMKAKLLKILKDTSMQKVKRNQCCLEPCLRQLVSCLEAVVNQEDTSSSDPYALPNSVTPPLPTFPRVSNAYGSYQDSNIPFPRTSGARFCGAGYLVYFTRPMTMHRTVSPTEPTPRSLSALSAYHSGLITPMKIRTESPGNLRLYGGSPTRSEKEQVSISSFYYKERVSPQLMTRKSRRWKSKREGTEASSRPIKAAGKVIIQDISCLLPVHKSLGEMYTLNVVWSLATVATDLCLDPNADPDLETPWAQHPFGRQLLESLLAHYCQLHDVQTLAMLCSVFETQSRPQGPPNLAGLAPQHPSSHSRYPSFTSSGSCSSMSDPGLSTSSWNIGLKGQDRDFWPRCACCWAGRRLFWLAPPLLRPANQLLAFVASKEMEHMLGWAESSPDDFRLGNLVYADPRDRERDQHDRNKRLLDPANTQQFDDFKKCYGEILYRWGLREKRAEVLKFVSCPPDPHKGIEFGVFCSYCRSEVRGIQCAICKGFAFQCAICHVAVRGSSNFCLTCGHGGHTSHMMEWFRTQEVCPTGCGCHCLLESTF
ncbi:hypothetical protein Chor_013235 [Crotalus horridus]